MRMRYDVVIQNQPINESGGAKGKASCRCSVLGDEAGQLKHWSGGWTTRGNFHGKPARGGPRPDMVPWKGNAPITPGNSKKKKQGTDIINKRAVPEHHGIKQHPVGYTQTWFLTHTRGHSNTITASCNGKRKRRRRLVPAERSAQRSALPASPSASPRAR